MVTKKIALLSWTAIVIKKNDIAVYLTNLWGILGSLGVVAGAFIDKQNGKAKIEKQKGKLGREGL